MSRAHGPATSLPHNKACNIEDFQNQDLAELIREIFFRDAETLGPDYPVGHERRQYWDAAMAVRTFQEHGVLRPDATVLGVGAKAERTVYFLTKKVGRVIATDNYLPPVSEETHPLSAMLTDPARFSPYPFDPTRLEVLHLDGRVLEFPDNSVDGVFCPNSFRYHDDKSSVAAQAFEMGRVLKPGGVLSITTLLRIAGPSRVQGPTDVLYFDPEKLQRYIVEASGLEPVDQMDPGVSDLTLTTPRNIFTQHNQTFDQMLASPYLVLVLAGNVFCSVHIALRKSSDYPTPDNAWARPLESLRASLRREAEELGDYLSDGPGCRTANRQREILAELARIRVDLEKALSQTHFYEAQLRRIEQDEIVHAQQFDLDRERMESRIADEEKRILHLEDCLRRADVTQGQAIERISQLHQDRARIEEKYVLLEEEKTSIEGLVRELEDEKDLLKSYCSTLVADQKSAEENAEKLESYIHAVRKSKPWRVLSFLRRLLRREW